jgi:hypothetical protein
MTQEVFGSEGDKKMNSTRGSQIREFMRTKNSLGELEDARVILFSYR